MTLLSSGRLFIVAPVQCLLTLNTRYGIHANKIIGHFSKSLFIYTE